MTAALDPYRTLGIPASSSRADAAQAHRRLAKRFHPDVNPGPGAVERMRRINEAWWILSNPERRARYDAGRVTPSWPGHRSGSTSTTWTAWPESRRAPAPPPRRPADPERVEFGDRPAVVVTVAAALVLLYFIGTWLGSIAR